MSEKGEEATEETTTTMTGAEEPQTEQPQQQQQQEIKKPEKFSFSIWPPTQRTRDAVINRLVETLTAPSVLSNRYGSMPSEEASSAARLIEENAFSAASSAHITDDDGMEILQTYSKEISRKMLEAVKSNAASASSQVSDASSIET